MGLLGISREMLADGDLPALAQTLQRMEKNFRRLDHLIQNIITITRNRLMEEDEQPIDLRTLVSEAIDALAATLAGLNPGAPQCRLAGGKVAPEFVLDCGLWNPATKSADVARWLADEAVAATAR